MKAALSELPKLVFLVALLIAYERGARARRAKGELDTKRALSFGLGVGVLAAALLPPIDSQATRFLWVHMVQHLLLALVAPPLLLYGRPGAAFSEVFRPRTRGGRAPALLLSPFLAVPLVAWLAHVLPMWGWHTPAVYDFATRVEPVHLTEHAMFFVGGLLFWALLGRPREGRNLSTPGSFFYVAFAAVASTALGALLTFASSPLYSFYAERPQPEMTPLEDQQLAGLIMWIPAGLVYVGAAALLFFRWLRGMEPDEARAGGPKMAVPPLLLLVAFGGMGALHATTAARAEPSPVVRAQIESRAPDVYLADCAYCHGPQGEGTSFGPSLTNVGRASADFMLRSGRMPIDEPDVYPQRGEPRYDEEDTRAMVEFIGSLGEGPDIPEVDVAAGDIVEGERLYNDNCAACHATTGIGGALTADAIAPPLHESSPVEIAEAIRIGGNGKEGSMPVFGPATLPQEDLDSIVRYVVYLQDPDDRGGAGLGHLGPIAEGLIGWVVGLGALILVILWIGDRGEEEPS